MREVKCHIQILRGVSTPTTEHGELRSRAQASIAQWWQEQLIRGVQVIDLHYVMVDVAGHNGCLFMISNMPEWPSKGLHQKRRRV